MIELTALEKEVIEAILVSTFSNQIGWAPAFKTLIVSSRSFSSLDKRSCVGFYTDFQENSLLSSLDDIPHSFSIQAKHAGLRAGELGLILFCDKTKKGVSVLEGFLYGDDLLPIEEFLKEKHNFIIGNTVTRLASKA